MTARRVMNLDVKTVPSDTTIWTALAIMRGEDIRHLPVTEGDRLLGIISNRDYRRVLERADPEGNIRGLRDIKVSAIMTSADSVITAHPDTPLLDIARLMVTRKIGCVPIIDDGRRLVGILTQKDIMRELTRERRL